MVIAVDQPWYRSIFHRPERQAPESKQTKADHGHAEAQFSLGEGFAADDAEAVLRYRKAANLNHALAQFTLGMMYADGRGVPRDDVQAGHWILRAAEQGYAAAQHNLGVRHRRASFTGLPKSAMESNLEAYKWFHLAAAQGHKASDGELENITLRMTREQVVEGNQRAARFTVGQSDPAQV
jgi:TPR repeat protein